MTDFNDRALQRRFAELRTDDRASAPGYDETLARRHAPSAVAFRAYPALVFAAAATVVFGLCLKHDARQATVTPRIAEWQPATDVLLNDRPALFGPMPPLSSSALDPFLR